MSNQKKHNILITSFGFKYSPPPDATFLFDARCLPNPFWEDSLKPLTGQDEAIKQYFEQFESVQKLVQGLEDYVALWLTHFEPSVAEQVIIAVGCTGGQHRSVYLTENLAGRLNNRLPEQFLIQTAHRDQVHWNQ
jgi:RNase adapter protein RapZ